MNIGKVYQVDIEKQMQDAYLDYAMSVIVSRALPNVRDGLKPVHRRILYAMHDMGLRFNHPHRKSARIVGEVLGKYHPHGDAAVYETMARMAQNFSMRIPLIDGQGNFGSVDGDPPAAMRYTEARLTQIAHEIMSDLDQNTVDFVANFDGSLSEPSVMPTKFPNLLVNGSTGIAVGMATSIPPHNLGEVCDALMFMLDQTQNDKEATLDELLQFINGPDFPTGGIIHRYPATDKSENNEDNDRIKAAYAVGRGCITVQAKAHIEEMSRNRNRLVITELPYQTNKASLIEKIADLVRDSKIEGIADLRDESDRQGMRLVIELTRTVEPTTILKQLFKMTSLQSTFSINMLALVEGEPTLLPLKRSLKLFIEHRQEIITRRSNHELEQAQKRLHILEGLQIAMDNLDEVVQIIIHSQSADTAKTNLCKKFKLTETQATAILDIPLRRLAALERKKIKQEYQDLQQRISELKELLQTPKKILQVIREELSLLKTTYGTPRVTKIVTTPMNGQDIIIANDLLPEENVIVAVSRAGKVCRWGAEENLQPARGEQTDPLHLALSAHTRDMLCFFTADGRAIIMPMHQIPIGQSPSEGATLSQLSGAEKVTIVAGVSFVNSDNLSGYLFLVSTLGRVKRILLSDLVAVRGHEALVMKLEGDDTLLTAFTTPGEGEVILVTQRGQAIRFLEEEVRPMGLPAVGVWGIKLLKNDQLVGAELVSPTGSLLVITRKGMGKRTPIDEYPCQGRHGQGVTSITPTEMSDTVAVAMMVQESHRVMLISQKGNSKIVSAKNLPQTARLRKGQPLMALRGRDELVGAILDFVS